ncbi:hypothetical protein [Halopseudomonas salegens]|uniref:Uncharacterized protein n=1 Tax=Halopseudomonas salegens TaxID=1434072 RepID=A0A1H2GJJ1_9GAMM|nr:hypothetical protein [Halopseudomonas salegens]SDU19735.1 hypothetical protein SAMN05216210_2351 [Halopseudomonas salegens]
MNTLKKIVLNSLILPCALLSSTAVLADTIEGTLDGEPQTWHVVKQDGASTAGFSELGPGMLNVSLQAHVEKRFATQGTLNISFVLMNGELISPPEASYFHTNRFMPNYGNQDTPKHWELSVSEVEGDSAHFVGQYQGTLTLQGTPEGDEPDSLELTVDFDVRAIRDN